MFIFIKIIIVTRRPVFCEKSRNENSFHKEFTNQVALVNIPSHVYICIHMCFIIN